jgi:hypothetical protein
LHLYLHALTHSFLASLAISLTIDFNQALETVSDHAIRASLHTAARYIAKHDNTSAEKCCRYRIASLRSDIPIFETEAYRLID